jgi:hypothetical protein
MFASGIDASASKGSKARIIVAQIVCENVSTKVVFTKNVVIYWYLIMVTCVLHRFSCGPCRCFPRGGELEFCPSFNVAWLNANRTVVNARSADDLVAELTSADIKPLGLGCPDDEMISRMSEADQQSVQRRGSAPVATL